MPDFFQRLMARAADLPGAQPRARPRLAHPFERAAPQQFEPVEAEVVARQAPTRPAVHTEVVQPVKVVEHHQESVRPVPETSRSTVINQHRTVTRVEAVTSVRRILERVDVPSPPLLLPVVHSGPVEVPSESPRPAAAAAPPQRARAGQSVRVVTDTRIGREPPASRRRPPEAERVVHVTIGRLEVKAATADRPRPQPRTDGRPAPMVPLDRYLAGEGRA